MKKVPDRIKDLPSLAQEIILFSKDMNQDGLEWRLRALLHRSPLDEPDRTPVTPSEAATGGLLGPKLPPDGWTSWLPPEMAKSGYTAAYRRNNRGPFEYITRGAEWRYHCSTGVLGFHELWQLSPDAIASSLEELVSFVEARPIFAEGRRHG